MIFTFIPEPKSATEAAFQARIMGRAKSLVADGYKLNEWKTAPGRYFVHSPEKAVYDVDTNDNTCTCECCAEHEYCKHLIACHMENERKLEEYQAEYLEEYARNHGLI